MDRKNTWILAGAIVVGFLAFGLTQLSAQRFPGDGRGGESMVGRYQVVRSSPDVILLLDTVTGDLYSASREDILPSSARQRGGRGFESDTRQDGFRKGFSKDKGDFPRNIDKAKDSRDDRFDKEKVEFPREIERKFDGRLKDEKK
jgi:hypothetical protein